MYKRFALKGFVALATVGMTAPLAAAGASASPSPNVSFSASSDGASAGWTAGKGSPIDLTLGTSPGSYAVVMLHHVGGTVGSLGDTGFTTDQYTPASPRYYITLNDGNSLWGYPSKAGLNGGTFSWAFDNGNTHHSWSDVQADDPGATVTGAYVIADAEQAAGTTDQIDNLTFNGVHFNN